jgi:hypothetical protein
MDIEDAFTQEAIEATGTNVGGEEEAELRGVIRNIYESNQFDVPNDPEENVAVLCFVAGRAYQHGLDAVENVVVNVPMSGLVVGEFIEFLAQRGSP